MNEMKCSVVLSAYCGHKYIASQIESIVNQSLIPDQFIIIDDCSPDEGKTVAEIDKYIQKYGYIEKHINDVNLGWAKSFIQGLNYVKNDIDVVFFADQDDIWRKDKIETMMSAFTDPKVNVVISDCIVFSKESVCFKEQSKSIVLMEDRFPFDKRFIYPKGVGAAMAIRKNFIDKYVSYWNETIGHDRFFQIMAVTYDKLYYLDEPLIAHRIHDKNATGKKSFRVDDRIRGIEGNLMLVERLIEEKPEGIHNENIEKNMYGYCKFARRRREMLKTKSYFRWLLLPLFDIGYYPTRKTWFGDFKAIGN